MEKCVNNRIKELERQADEYADGLGLAGDEWCDAQSTKFAELIVKECMRVSMKATGLDAEYEAWYLIKEHFGVDNK